jgi:hypothetical protein
MTFSHRSAPGCEKPPDREGVKTMLTVGWIIVLIGVVEIHWADGRFQAY